VHVCEAGLKKYYYYSTEKKIREQVFDLFETIALAFVTLSQPSRRGVQNFRLLTLAGIAL